MSDESEAALIMLSKAKSKEKYGVMMSFFECLSVWLNYINCVTVNTDK